MAKTQEEIEAERVAAWKAAMAVTEERRKDFAPALHKAVPMYENAPCYDTEELAALQRLGAAIMDTEDRSRRLELIRQFEDLRDSIKMLPDHPEPVQLWPDGVLPSITDYTDNTSLRWNHDPGFRPFLYELLVPEDVTPKGLVVFCAGGDHGAAMFHEGYGSCLDFIEMGYQTILVGNRTNACPWKGQDAAADVSRAIRYARANAERLRIDPDKVALAGFSNGGITGENVIQYFSGEKKMTDIYKDYQPDGLDEYCGAPDAFMCVYGPRYEAAPFSWDGVVYPPVFFAIGREDGAIDNFNYVYPDLVAHNVKVEIHTFAGTPHGQAGVKLLDGYYKYPNFQMWVPLADYFLQDAFKD